ILYPTTLPLAASQESCDPLTLRLLGSEGELPLSLIELEEAPVFADKEIFSQVSRLVRGNKTDKSSNSSQLFSSKNSVLKAYPEDLLEKVNSLGVLSPAMTSFPSTRTS